MNLIPHISAEASGPSYSVPRLCQAVAARGHDVSLACLGSAKVIPGVEVYAYPEWPWMKRLGISPRFIMSLWSRANCFDIVHNHSLWSMVNVAAGVVVPKRGAKLVTSPRGTLSDRALSRSRGRKRVLWPVQKAALEEADLLHATSDQEYEDIRNFGLKNPVVIAPNGVDVPPVYEKSKNEEKVLLFLSRLHPIKGVDRLLEAWVSLEMLHGEWRLRIVGPGDRAYTRELMDIVACRRLKRVEFVGALYGREKEAAYRSADLFVLPTHSENFGMAVAEALAFGVPVVVGRGAPWGGVVSNRCGWWIDNDVESITFALNEAMSMSDSERLEMGVKGRAWVEGAFSWEAIASLMVDSYHWVLHGGAMPACVKID